VGLTDLLNLFFVFKPWLKVVRVFDLGLGVHCLRLDFVAIVFLILIGLRIDAILTTDLNHTY
jgi:hypothetical protein